MRRIDVVDGEQDLPDRAAVPAERVGVGPHQQALPHAGRGLLGGQVARADLEPNGARPAAMAPEDTSTTSPPGARPARRARRRARRPGPVEAAGAVVREDEPTLTTTRRAAATISSRVCTHCSFSPRAERDAPAWFSHAGCRTPVLGWRGGHVTTPDEYVEAVLQVVERIPAGRVMAYGAIAEWLHDRFGRGSARRVGTIMAQYGGSCALASGGVQARGRLPPGHELQAQDRSLEAEGVVFRGPRIRMARLLLVAGGSRGAASTTPLTWADSIRHHGRHRWSPRRPARSPARGRDLPSRVRIGYSTGSLVTGAFGTVPGLLLLPYLTDTLGVAAGLAGMLVLLPKAWDVVVNPVAGRLSDRTRTRWGARRPYLLVGRPGHGRAVRVDLRRCLHRRAPARCGSAWRSWPPRPRSRSSRCPYVAMPADMTEAAGLTDTVRRTHPHDDLAGRRRWR